MFSFNATMLSERLIETYNGRNIRSHMEPLARSFVRCRLAASGDAAPMSRGAYEALHTVLFREGDGSHSGGAVLRSVVTARLMVEGGALPATTSFALDFLSLSNVCVPGAAPGQWDASGASVVRLLMAAENRVQRVWTLPDTWRFVGDASLTLQRVLDSDTWRAAVAVIAEVAECDARAVAQPDALFFNCYCGNVDVVDAASIAKTLLARREQQT